MKQPRFIFDFPASGDPQGRAVRREFRTPVEIIHATSVPEVVPALQRVQQLTAAGQWAAGFVTYEAAPAFEPAMEVRRGRRMPLLYFGIFDSPYDGPPDEIYPHMAEVLWEEQTTPAEFHSAINVIQEAIAAGETYQVNYTNRLKGMFNGVAQGWYEHMRQAQGTGYHAYIDTGDHTIVSASPELFFERRGAHIATRPMKGTRPRGRWAEEDAVNAEALLASEKDRAENLMIVDLLRNDLGRIAETGSVEVSSLFAVERYRTVWQLTSRIEATLIPDVDLAGIFAALFPCGSVTGAPKINTMRWISRLEDSPREIYCGAIGVIEPGGDCTFNVPIRTAWIENKTGAVTYGVGSGITADSNAAEELAELRAKAAILYTPSERFELIETIRCEEGELVRRDRHFRRVLESAAYFDFRVNRARMQEWLNEAADATREPSVIRMTVSDGSLGVSTGGCAPPRYEDRDACRRADALQSVALSPAPVNSRDPFLTHKTTNRSVYHLHRVTAPDAFDVLLWNENDDVTEFTFGNIVVELNGSLFTPPRSAGLLPGVFRAELLDEGVISERTIKRTELPSCTRMWLVNSLREWVEVKLRA